MKITTLTAAAMAVLLGVTGAAFSQVKQQKIQVQEVVVQVPVAQAVTITATDFSFDPKEITAKPGQQITITLVNKSKHKHNIEFKMPNGSVKLDKDLEPGQTGTLQLTAPAPGTFTFDCPVDMHKTLGMKGRLVVKE